MHKIQNCLLYIYFFSINFELWDPFNTGVDFFITKVTVVLYVCLTFFNPSFFYSVKNIKKYLYPLWLFFLLLIFMNYKNRNGYYYEIVTFSYLFNFLMLHATINHSKRDPSLLLRGFFVFAGSSFCLTILYLFNFETTYIWTGIGNRMTILGCNANEVGIRLSISILFLVVILKENTFNKKINSLAYFFIPFMLYFLVATGSRVAFCSLFFGLGLYYLLLGKFSIKKLSRIIVFAISIVLVWIFFIKKSVLATRLLISLQDVSFGGRKILWEKAIDIFLDNVLFGIGKTGSDLLMESYLKINWSIHNVFLEVLCYTGIVGLVFFITFLYKIFCAAIKSYKGQKILLPLILLVPVGGLILSGQIFEQKIVWLIFAYVISNYETHFSLSKNHYTGTAKITHVLFN